MAENDKITAPEGPRVRYSDEELEEFRAIINDMLSKARKEYDTLRRVITHGGSNDIEDTAPSFKTVEDDGAFQLTKEEAGQLALQHIDEETDYLKALYRDTHVKLLRPRMASGHLQGRMLKMFVRMIRPKQILEIGTYSGYSALCLAEGLEDGGMLHTFEINDEQEDFTRPWLEQSPYADRIKFYIGDALELLPQMDITFDLAFVDGDKRKYIEYYEQVLKMLSPGGYIIADNTLWDGHVLEEPHHTDMQTIGIKKFYDLVATDKRVEKVILPLRDGLTIIRKK